jgi:hypothetical protein
MSGLHVMQGDCNHFIREKNEGMNMSELILKKKFIIKNFSWEKFLNF